jgi:hypothetical protein
MHIEIKPEVKPEVKPVPGKTGKSLSLTVRRMSANPVSLLKWNVKQIVGIRNVAYCRM